MVNGLQQPQPAPSGMDTPLAYYQPVTITPGTLKWIAGAIASVMVVLAGSPVFDRWVNPAKDSDLKALTAIVQVLQQGQTDASQAVQRLTLAVDNLAGIVAAMKDAPPRTIERYLPSPVGKARPR